MITQLEHCIALEDDESTLFLTCSSLTVSESKNTRSKALFDSFLISSQLEEYLAIPEISRHELLAWRVGFITSSESNAFY
jgi:hypothetical protein